jgi:hypothetical protein
VINWGDKASRGKREYTEGPDEVGEAAREHRPDKVGKGPAKPAKGFLIGLQTASNVSQSCLAGRGFEREKLLFNRDRCSTSRFKLFLSSHKVNSLLGLLQILVN